MRFILSLLTWWHGQSLGTRLFTWRRGVRLGEDEQGNIFYRNADDSRRWVIFNGEPEASRISPEWHGWLHHTFDDCPAEKPLSHKSWEKPQQDNMTGTEQAYAPTGSLRQAQVSQRRDYEAWQPE